MKDYSRLIQQCETWVRAGQTGLCATAMQTLNTARVPSIYRRELAVLARRIGHPQLGLRLLTPLFREDFSDAKPADLAEYAVLLQRCGANREALSLLAGIPTDKVPDVSLYRAFAHFNVWEYEQSIRHLHEYIQAPISPYWRTVGRVNMADALIFTERTAEAKELLEQLVTELRASNHNRLLANCLEMLGQIHLLQNDVLKAEVFLNESAAFLSQGASLDRLYVSRWQAILSAVKAADTGPLLRFRREALERKEFESVRQADFFRLKIAFDQDLFTHIYVGTPFPAYRAKLQRAFGCTPDVESYIWGEREGRHFNVKDASIDGTGTDIRGLKSHALLAEMAKDFYRTKRVAEIFAALWPDEHFNIFSSPQRVHQLVARTRHWLNEQDLKLTLESTPSGYRIGFAPGAGLVVPLELPPALAYERHLHDLRKTAPDGFTQRQAREALGLSTTAFRRFCAWAVQQGRLEKFGASSSTRYFFAS